MIKMSNNSRKYKTIIIYALVFLFLFTVLLNVFNAINSKDMHLNAQEGTLDLTGWNFDNSQTIFLNGKWEFYWNQFLDYDELHNTNIKPDAYVGVPEVWNIRNNKLQEEGYATYRLRVKLPYDTKSFSMLLPTMSTAYELYLNNKLIAKSGIIGNDSASYSPALVPLIIDILMPEKDFDIIIHVANFSYVRGGIWYPIEMGTYEQILRSSINHLIKNVVMIGILLIIGVYFFFMMILHNEKIVCFYFTVGCIILFFRTIIYSNMFHLIFQSNLTAAVFIEYLTIFWGPVIFALLVSKLFPNKYSKRLNILIIYSVLLTLIIIFTSAEFYTKYFFLFEVIAILIVLYSIVTVFAAAIKKKPDALLLTYSNIVLLITLMYDFLYQNDIIYSKAGEFSSLGYCFFILIYSVIIASRQADALHEVKSIPYRLLSSVNTPINTIIGITNALKESTQGKLSFDQQKSLSLISSSGNQLSNITIDILDISKLNNGEIKLNKCEIDLHDIFIQFVVAFKHLNYKENVSFRYMIEDNVPLVLADEERLIQLLYHLVENAWNFSEKGEIILSACVKNKMVEISVEDQGIGIPHDKLEDVFIPFCQIDNNMVIPHKGAGLGLSIAKQLVNLHGGIITAESEINIGSKFSFTLPVFTGNWKKRKKNSKITSKGNIEMIHSTEAVQNFTRNGNLILVMSNDIAERQSIIGILELEGYSILTAANEQEALKIIKDKPELCLIIMNLMINAQGCKSFCREIRDIKDQYVLPILMVSGRSKIDMILSGMDAGANDFLMKPFESRELKARVKTLVDLKQSIDKALSAEIIFLHSQIKPHFIHNALNTIISISREDSDQARELLLEFSNYLRGCFDFRNFDDIISIEKEISHVKSYIAIENARFGDRLKIKYNIENYNFYLPPLTIQPIVENSVIHGLRPKPEGGSITVSAITKGDNIIIVIEDDGVGIPEDKLKNILSNNLFNNSIGLYNINQRLKRLHGKTLKINSILGKGTIVQMEIPNKGELI